MRRAYHTSKAAKEGKTSPPIPITPVDSPRTTDGEGDSLSSPASPASPEAEGGEEEGDGLHFEPLRSVVFERKDEVSHKIDEASVEARDKGRE